MADYHTDNERELLNFWDSKPIQNNTLYGSGFGLIFLMVSWCIEIISKDISISISGLIGMHSQNPIILIIDCAPFVLGAIAFYQSFRKELSKIEFKESIIEKEKIIDINAQFAQKIGEGVLDANLETDKDDILGQSLLMMRDNLASNQDKEQEENWIAKGKDIISTVLRKYNNINELAYEVVVSLLNFTDTVQGAFYIYDDEEDVIENIATHAYSRKKYFNQKFKIGQGLIGQAAFELDYVYRTDVPNDYATITSGIIGDKKPGSVFIVPLVGDDKLQGIIEIASLENEITPLKRKFILEVAEIIGQTIFNLRANQKTEKLLGDAQKMTDELQENEEQLRENAEAMMIAQEDLEKSNKQLEDKVQEVENSEKRLYSLLENASEVISIYDIDGSIRYESPSVKNILGFSSEDMVGNTQGSRVHNNEKETMEHIFARLLTKPAEAQTFEFRYTKEDGSIIWLESTGRNFINDPAINGLIFNTRDITQHKLAEQEQKKRGQMQSLSENSPDMILRLNIEEGKIYYTNPRIKDVIGLDPENAINKVFNETEANEVIKEFFTNKIEELKGNPIKGNDEITITTPQGERIMSINSIPEFSDDNEMETVLFVAHDITEAKQRELEIHDKNKKITESINYAERIQGAILPDNKVIQKFFPNSFIFYEPRDIVSGDFPWFFEKNGDYYIAAVDCTGHGVPGALLSLIGYFILNNIVDHYDDINAGEILDHLHARVRTTLRQDVPGAEARDGMDIALIKINNKQNEIQFAGAHRPLYLYTDNELVQFKGDRKAIGGIPHKKKAEKPFVNHTIKVKPDDNIFFFSDGLPDQLGCKENRLKKYSPKRIRDYIEDNSKLTMDEYHKLFENDFVTWMGDSKQIDDVLLIGIKF